MSSNESVSDHASSNPSSKLAGETRSSRRRLVDTVDHGSSSKDMPLRPRRLAGVAGWEMALNVTLPIKPGFLPALNAVRKPLFGARRRMCFELAKGQTSSRNGPL